MSYEATFWFLNPIFLFLVLIIAFIFVLSKFKWKKFIEEVKNHREDANKLKAEI